MFACNVIFKFCRSFRENLVPAATRIYWYSGSSCHQPSRTSLYAVARDNPVIMKIDSAEFKAIFTPELTTLASLFDNYGHELRIAGGAVRDLLIGIQPHDLDFATTATPQQMKEMFTKEDIRLINMKGEKHGTITPRINDKENFEVTTLRIDVVTDGRRAEVEFTKDWKLDANRRDLTINSMFLGLDGTVYDYFNGYEDLQNKRIAFVGDAATRICEDYLRILRYFRFHGRIVQDHAYHDPDTLQAIQSHKQGLDQISGERIWSELNRILAGNNAGELFMKMLDLGLGPHIGLPSSVDLDTFKKIWHHGKNLQLHPITLLCGLLTNVEELLSFHNRVKLSAFDRDLGIFVLENRHDQLSINPLRPYQLLVLSTGGKGKTSDTQKWVNEVLKYRGDTQLLDQFQAWTIPRFPLNGNILKEHGVPRGGSATQTKPSKLYERVIALTPKTMFPLTARFDGDARYNSFIGGKKMGPVMQKLRVHWAEHDFSLTADQLLEHLPHVLGTLGLPSPNNKER